MNNEDMYKKAMDNIHPSEDLVNKTINKVATQPTKEHKSLKNFLSYSIAGLYACIAVMIIIVNIIPLHRTEPPSIIATSEPEVRVDEKEVLDFVKPFASQEELDKRIEELTKSSNRRFDIQDYEDMEILEFENSVSNGERFGAASTKDSSGSANTNYSKTNIQVEGVDEADIIKTDGNNIYLIKNDTFIVVDKDLKLKEKKIYRSENLSLNNLYITADNIVIIASENRPYDEEKRNYGKSFTTVLVLEKESYKEKRRVSLEGSIEDSRLIGDNLYFVTKKYIDRGIDRSIVPTYMDTVKSDDENEMLYSDIYYVEGYNGRQFINVGAFNIKDDKELKYKSFFGFRSTIYCSNNNMYFINDNSIYEDKIDIIKMNLDKTNLTLVAKATLPGSINDQFSVDEYDGNLRVATTEYDYSFDDEENISNHLFILNDKLETIGQTEDYAINERIYAVRFVGKIGYVVTFKEVDPLFVMDLSDPTNPKIKGKLKVPGYSSYLHPYDENHIIGIGYNVKSNGYGGVKNDSMKMSMFDVSDLNNPKELYSVDIGDAGEHGFVSSSVLSNHKALLYDKERSLIGFPINVNSKSGFVVYKIEKDGFKELASSYEENYFLNMQRIIYIEDTLYALAYDKITSYNLFTMKKEKEYDFEVEYIYNDTDVIMDMDIVQ